MSGSFREVYNAPFMYQALGQASEIDGAHPITNVLSDLYGVLSELEKACAWYEDADSGYDRPTLQLQDSFPKIFDVINELAVIYRQDRQVIEAALRAEAEKAEKTEK